jgi:predicted RNase H-like nuclease (RuvC/YqgF family)
MQLEKICQGYADANQKASTELYDLRERVKRLSKELDGEKKNVDTLKKQALERTERVFIEKE